MNTVVNGAAVRITYLRKQEAGIGKCIKHTVLNFPYCSNCPTPLNHAYSNLHAYANNEGKD